MPDQSTSILPDTSDRVGLCATCRHARVVQSSHGSTFYRCRLAETDSRFAKYPRLPVLRCAGYAPAQDVKNTGSHPKTETGP